ncbi:MAG: hypothetical protein J5910_10780 [Lachnospiraceae bacterium]|nr:hypothetical protein [Lachnospiraceae bacterium]
MKKIRIMAALVAVFAMLMGTVVYGAPSPVAGTVTVVTPGKPGGSAASVKAPTQKELSQLASYIEESAAGMGVTATVKTSISIVAPADYKGGDIPTVVAVAGIPNGASNVFAFILLPNGKKTIIPCTVRNGYVGFVAPAFGTVSIVVLDKAPGTAANAGSIGNATTMPATLH